MQQGDEQHPLAPPASREAGRDAVQDRLRCAMATQSPMPSVEQQAQQDRPGTVASSTIAVPMLLTSAAWIGTRCRQAEAAVAPPRETGTRRRCRPRRDAGRRTSPGPGRCHPRCHRCRGGARSRAAGTASRPVSTSAMPSTYQARRRSHARQPPSRSESSYSAAPKRCASRRSRTSSPASPMNRSSVLDGLPHRQVSRRRCAAPPGRLPAGSRRCPPASCAACPPSASRAACACA